jgi:chemotaxis protein methyltransferase CheR
MTWSAPIFADIAALVAERSGLAFPPSRRAFAETGIARAMMRAQSKDASHYLQRLHGEETLLVALLGEVTVGETYFNRDPAQIEFITKVALPELDRPVRVWSAGCSTGEEAYSLAIAFEECQYESRSHIVATDLSDLSIQAARKGAYGEWSFRETNAAWRSRYFVRTGKARWQIAPRFLPRVQFEISNLVDAPSSLNTFDIILCRNVLMYFEPEVIDRVAALLTMSLREGGWLLTSPSDPMLREFDDIDVVSTPAGLAYRRVTRVPKAIPESVVEDVPRAGVLRRAEPGWRERGESERAFSKERKRERPARGMSSTTLSVSTPPPESHETLSAEQFVHEAMQLLDQDRVDEAAIAARRAVFLDRNDALAHLLLGRALRLCGRGNSARRALRRAKRLGQGNDEITVAVDAEIALLGRALTEATV